jgi:hypothetical protein
MAAVGRAYGAAARWNGRYVNIPMKPKKSDPPTR